MPTSYPRRSASSLAKPQRDFATIQGELFAALATPSVMGSANAPELDIGPELMGAVNTALREARGSNLSRDRVTDRLNLALASGGKAVTKRQMDAWTAQSKEFHELPARYLPALCWATGSEAPLRVLAHALGFELVDAREQAAKRLGEVQIEIARLKREGGAITKTLGGA